MTRAAAIGYQFYAMSGLEANSVELAVRSSVVALYATSAELGDYAATVSQVGFSIQNAAESLSQGDTVSTSLALGSALYNYYFI